MVEPSATDMRALAEQYRSRAQNAYPPIAQILAEIARDLEDDALRLERGK